MELFKDQQEAFDFVERSTGPVFITGPAGTGKSQLLRYLAENGKDASSTEIVAFTGTAAVNVGGRTIHNLMLNSKAWNSGIQVFVPLRDNRQIKKSSLDELKRLKLLIIDEVSMVRADMIDAIDLGLRLAHGNKLPFGGIRVAMFGDLRQLPPFVEFRNLQNRERRFIASYEDPENSYFFMAHVFKISPVSRFDLYIQKRQSGPDQEKFVQSLNGLRRAEPDPDAIFFINQASNTNPDRGSTHLFPKRKQARSYNETKLLMLPGEAVEYKARFVKTEYSEEPAEAKPPKDDKLPAPYILRLKLGARVMVLANLDLSLGLSNGAIGTVVALGRNSVEIELDRDKSRHVIGVHSFDWKGLALDADKVLGDDSRQFEGIRRTKVIGSYIQLPLQLAWALTVHKAQGATLDELTVDFSEPFPSSGQAYVALSRLRSVGGLSRIGKLGRWHFPKYSAHLDHFESLTSSEPLTQHKSLAEALRGSMPWRPLSEILEILDNHLELVPAVRDIFNFSHKKRIAYLRDQDLTSPANYLIRLFEQDPAVAISLARNIDRSIRNKPLVLHRQVLGSEFEEFLRDNFEILLEDYRKLYAVHGPEGWRQVAADAVGIGRDFLAREIPEYEVTELQIHWKTHTATIEFDMNPAAKERIWKIDANFVTPELGTQFVSLAKLVIAYQPIFQNLGPEIRIEASGQVASQQLWGFIPYLFTESQIIQSVTINGVEVSLDLLPVMQSDQKLRMSELTFTPEVERTYPIGSQVRLVRGRYIGEIGNVFEYERHSNVTMLWVDLSGRIEPIITRSEFVLPFE